MGGDNRCTVWNQHDLYRCAMTLCKGTEENRRTGATLFAEFRRQHLEMEIRLNGQKIRTGVAGAKKRSRKVKRKVLREERRKVEKRPLSRLQISITAIRLRHVVGKHHGSYPTGAILQTFTVRPTCVDFADLALDDLSKIHVVSRCRGETGSRGRNRRARRSRKNLVSKCPGVRLA